MKPTQEAVKKALANNDAFQMTAYAICGEVGKTEYIQQAADNLNITIDLLPYFNEYLSLNNSETISGMDNLDDYLRTLDPVEAFRLGVIGTFSYSDDYYSLDEYGNIESYSEYQVIALMRNSEDFRQWYVTEYGDLDPDTVNQAIRDCNILLAAGY